MRCRVKVCGITSVADAQAVVDSGADAIALMFYPPSSRYLEKEQAAEILHSLPPYVSSVGLFLDADADFIRETLAAVPVDMLQFHGSEAPDFCRSFDRPYYKAVGMKGLLASGGFAAYADQYTDARAILVDSHEPGAAGGTGEVFDWMQVPQGYHKPIILAGGLKPENVGEAILATKVYAVDVSSGVESAPGIKDHRRVSDFMRAVRAAEQRV